MMCCVKGKGHAVLPVCWLQPDPSTDPISEEDEEACNRESENDMKVSLVCWVVFCVHVYVYILEYYHHIILLLLQTHKYVIQATITRDSWPAGESAWSYMTTLKQIEKMDDSV